MNDSENQEVDASPDKKFPRRGIQIGQGEKEVGRQLTHLYIYVAILTQ